MLRVIITAERCLSGNTMKDPVFVTSPLNYLLAVIPLS